MTFKALLLPLLIFISVCTQAAPLGDSTEFYKQKYKEYTDSVSGTLKFQTGKISIESGKIELDVPDGFKYLGKEQSAYVITDVWGNPPENTEGVVGMIFPVNADLFNDSTYAFIVTFSEVGYVKDDDASKIDYDKMLKEIQGEEKEVNEQRAKAGYGPIHLVGWAQKPYYDEKKKILHWAKELKFGDAEEHTLNYEVRILGRKGMIELNAVGGINQLPMVNADIPKILDMASFTSGNAYSDFDPDIDQVAAWTIGGLVAGKLLAKAGLLAVALKFLAPLWKFLALLVLPISAWVRKRFFKKKETVIPQYYEQTPALDKPVFNYETLSEALTDLNRRGYTNDFALMTNCIECKGLDIQLHPEDFEIDEFYRFEGMSDPDDSSVVYAISSRQGVKGTLTDAYGVYAENMSPEMANKLKMHHG